MLPLPLRCVIITRIEFCFRATSSLLLFDASERYASIARRVVLFDDSWVVWRLFFLAGKNVGTAIKSIVSRSIKRTLEALESEISPIDRHFETILRTLTSRGRGRKRRRWRYSPFVGIRGRAELAQHAVQIGRQGIKQLKEKHKG